MKRLLMGLSASIMLVLCSTTEDTMATPISDAQRQKVVAHLLSGNSGQNLVELLWEHLPDDYKAALVLEAETTEVRQSIDYREMYRRYEPLRGSTIW